MLETRQAELHRSYAKLLRLTPLMESAAPLPPVSAPPSTVPQDLRKRLGGWMSFLLLVILPSLLATGYFFLLAADRYVAEARFVLRTPAKTVAGEQLHAMLQSSGVTRSTDDGYVVQEFLESRDAMAILENTSQLRDAYAAAGRDPFWRVPSLFGSDSREGMYKLYRRLVSSTYDSSTGVGALSVQAFAPADAERLATGLLDAAETLVNRISDRARQDTIGLAQAEVDKMRQRLATSQADLTAFRERERLVDPSQATLAVLETIAKLAADAAQASVQINELGMSSPNAPQLTSLRTRRAALEAQIAVERQRLAGDVQSIAPRIVEYETLMLERDFAEKALVAAMTSMEMARVDALKQQIYLERVSKPSLPDYPPYPWRMVWCLAILAGGLMCWRIWRILSADIVRHARP